MDAALDAQNDTPQTCMMCQKKFNALMFTCPHCGAKGSTMMSGGSEMLDIMRKKQEATELNDEGGRMYQQGRLKDAQGQFRKAIEKNPLYEQAYENLAYMLMEEGNYREATNVLERLLAFNPRREAAHRFMAQAKARL